MAVEETSRFGSRWLWLALCLAIALGVRLLALAQFQNVASPPWFDEAYYVVMAESIAQGDGHPGSFRPPLYPAFLAGLFQVFGRDLQVVRLVQVLVSLVAVIGVFQMACARFGTRAGFLSGCACALIPCLVHYPHYLWAECFATSIVVLLFWALDRFDRRDELWSIAGAGLLLGAAALVRETWFHFGVLVLVWLAWREGWSWRRAARPAALLAAGALLVVLPWSVRNYRVHGSFVLISTCRWFPVATGNYLPEENWLYAGKPAGRLELLRQNPGMTELEEERHWKAVALEAIRAQQPWWILKKLVRNTTFLFSPRSKQIYYLGWGVLLDPSKVGAFTLLVTDVAGYVLAMALGLAGLWLVPGGRIKVLVVGAVLFTLSVHVIANADARFRVPLMPFFALFIGPLLAGLRVRSAWRAVGLAACLLAFATILWLRWGMDLGPAWRRAWQL